MVSGSLHDTVQPATALVVAIAAIFGAALLADVVGLIPHDAPTATADGAEAVVHSSVDEKQLRFGIMGGFVVLCIFAIFRYHGTM